MQKKSKVLFEPAVKDDFNLLQSRDDENSKCSYRSVQQL